MSATISTAHPLIDKFLPNPDFFAAYAISIDAPASVVYARLLVTDFNASRIVRLLLSLRTGRRVRRHRAPSELRQRFTDTGFVILAERPGEEVVIGVVGKFWRPDGGRCLELKPGGFVAFSHPGSAKVAMNFRVRSDSPDQTLLSTETRIACFGRAAWWKFRLYWALIAPFSGLIRKAILMQVKADAEAKVGEAS